MDPYEATAVKPVALGFSRHISYRQVSDGAQGPVLKYLTALVSSSAFGLEKKSRNGSPLGRGLCVVLSYHVSLAWIFSWVPALLKGTKEMREKEREEKRKKRKRVREREQTHKVETIRPKPPDDGLEGGYPRVCALVLVVGADDVHLGARELVEVAVGGDA